MARKALERLTQERARRECIRLGVPIDDADPGGTLLALVREAAGNVEFYRSLVAELAYSRLGKVTSNEAYYRRAGSLACQVTPGGATGDKTDGCSTSDYVGMQMLFTPQYLQIQPSLDIELPMSLAYNLRGNAPSSGGGSEGEMSWSVGAKFIYRQKHELQLMYADTAARTKYDPTGNTVIGGRGSVGTTDRAWWALTFKTGF